MRILIAGESWVTHSIHVKGFDSFTTSSYEEGVHWLRAALERANYKVDFMPNHLVPREFPTAIADLEPYSIVMLSDCGSNTLLLHPDTFAKSEKTPDRLAVIHDYVQRGGSLLMIGGYMTFQGIDGKARYHGTPIEDALPVIIQATDDRVEIPAGIHPVPVQPRHPILAGIEGEWPAFLGYNRFTARPSAQVLLTIGDDPFLVVWDYGKGRAAAFASDCGPHWGPPEYLNWQHHDRFWGQFAHWLSRTPGWATDIAKSQRPPFFKLGPPDAAPEVERRRPRIPRRPS
ncbi:MAG: cytoplasmic protein [Chloroflexi bacterium]|nr:cytoplasmic protein [Chloroflexota bacterium]